MPIRPEMRKRYPKEWPLIRAKIFARAGQRRNHHGVVTQEARCEWCGVENHAMGQRLADGSFVELSPVEAETAYYVDGERVTMIVLTLAHIHDPSPENCDESNLAALCQRCHLRHDLPQHLVSREENAIAREVANGQMLISEL